MTHRVSQGAVLTRHNAKREALEPAHGYRVGGPMQTVSEAWGTAIRGRAAVTREERVPFIEWALRIPEPKTGRLDFAEYPFQLELYKEGAADREVVVIKATQVGISAYLTRWVMYWPDVRSATGLYVFPKLKQMYDFSDARVKQSILKSDYLRGRIPGGHIQNKGLKQIGLGMCYFRGSESEDDLDSVDADALALDEYNRLHPPNIPVAERRISGVGSLGLMRRVGVPTIPNFGLSKLYQDTDMRRWMVKCPRCSTWQRMTWANVDVEKAKRVCASCHRDLRPADVAGGQWVAEYPDREVRGYHIPKLIVPRISLKPIIENSQKTLPEDVQAFWNRDLAEAFAPEEGRLSPEAIAAASSAGATAGATAKGIAYTGRNYTTMGVDVASARALNVRVSEILPNGFRKALCARTVEDFNEVALLMERFRVNMAIVDYMPEFRTAMGLAERFPGRVYLLSYAGSHQADVVKVDNPHRRVSVRRTEAIDGTFEQVRQQTNLLPPDAHPSYYEHLQALIRVVEKTASGQTTVRYESTGRDDFAHAEVYDLVALQMWWIRQQLDAHAGPLTTRLEEHLEFERSAAHGDDDALYVPGPTQDTYSPM